VKKLLFGIILFCASFSLSFSAWPKFYVDAGAGVALESPTAQGYLFSGTGSIGIEFIDHFSVYLQVQFGSSPAHLDVPTPGWSTTFENFLPSIGLEYSYYFGRFGILGGISFGFMSKKRIEYWSPTTNEFPSDGFFVALNAGVSFLATQYIEPFVKFQYIFAIMPYNTTAWPVDMDIAFYIGVRFNIFKTKHLDKGY